MKAHIIIADDHLVVRQGLRQMLQGRARLEVVGEAADGIAAEHLARSLLADLLILDIGLPLRRGMAVCERLRADGILMPILFFSMYPQSQYAPVARRMGAQGFVGKEASGATVLAAVDQLLAGHSYFADSSLHADTAHADKETGSAGPGRAPKAPRSLFADLSARELEVLRALVAGQSLVSLATRLGLNNKTLSTYRRRLLGKLGLRTNAELVALAILHGFQ